MKKPTNINYISHLDLPKYTEEIIDLFTKCDDNNFSDSFVDQIKNHLKDYNEFIKNAFDNEDDIEINDLDLKRHIAFEKLVDSLDDIRNITIIDLDFDLCKLDVDEEEAIYLIPEYAASEKLLPPHHENPEKGVNISSGNKLGHGWDTARINKYIEQLKNPSLKHHMKTTGVTHLVESLIEADNRLKMSLSKDSVTITIDKLNTIRDKHYLISMGIQVMYRTIYSFEENNKDVKEVYAHEIFYDRFVTIYEQSELEKFSFCDFSCSTLLSLLPKYNEKILKSEILNEYIKMMFENSAELFKITIEPLKKCKYWNQLDSLETELLQKNEQLLLTVAFQFKCVYVQGNKKLWEEHKKTEEYKAAEALFKEIDFNKFDNVIFISKGYLINPTFRDDVLTSWDTPDNFYHLKLLGCQELFEEIKQLELQSELFNLRSPLKNS